MYEISMLYLLFYVKSNISMTYLTESSDGAQDSCIIGGTQQMAFHLASLVGSDRIVSCPNIYIFLFSKLDLRLLIIFWVFVRS
jgi:hypothetical protein